MFDVIFTLRAATSVRARRETVGGREFLVSPVVAIVAGVLNEELAPAEEIAAAGSSWNGMPIPIGHPMVNGRAVSANVPEVAVNCPGRFYGAVDGDRLRGEIWIDLEAAARIGGDALLAVQRLEKGDPIDVSTGYFRQVDPTPGTWNGQAYTAIQRNIKPDHLAILLDEQGACDWRMGCGTPRINHAIGEETMEFQTIQVNMELSLDDQMSKVYSAFSEKFNHNDSPEAPGEDRPHYYVREMFADRLISSGVGKLWQLNYSIDEQGMVTFGEPVEVEVVYQPVASPATNADAAGNSSDCPCKAKKPGIWRTIWQKFVGNSAEVAQETAGETVVDGDASAAPDVAVVANQAQGGMIDEHAPQFVVGNGGHEKATFISNEAVAVSQLREMVIALSARLDALQTNAISTGSVSTSSTSGVSTGSTDEGGEQARLVADLAANDRNTLSQAELSELSVNALRALQSAYQPTSYAGRGLPQAETRGKTVMAMPSLD
jgi:hypothetical protein